MLTAWTGALLHTLGELGIDGASLAEDAGIDSAALADPDRRVPLAASTSLWRLAVEATGDEALGLAVSRNVRPGTFHTLGHAVLTSATLLDALRRIARFSAVTADVAEVHLEESTDRVTLVITWRPGAAVPADEAVDAVVVSIVRSARFMLDRSVAPLDVAMARTAPVDPTPWEAVLRCPLAFDAEHVAISFDRTTAERRVSGANTTIARLHDEVSEAYVASLDPETAARRVRAVLPDLLPSGAPNVRAVAAALAMSSRTLQRRLAEEGTSFRSLVEAVRRDLAIGYLERGEHSVTEVTYLLGFSETPTFSRAFKTWTGTPPSRHPRS